MTRPHRHARVFVLVLVAAACASAGRSAPGGRAAGGHVGPYTAADVAFMQGMIHHHAQALIMTAWARTHGASPQLLTLSERIDVGQKDEIAMMERWLRDRDEAVPEIDVAHATMGHGPHMPGMLTAEQLAQLDRARGAEFDRLFLTFMIQHHQGAVTMVEELFAAPGGAQEDTVFRLASDINSDQLADIDRMTRMLAAMPAADQR